VLASRSSRETDAGVQRIEDPALATALKRRSVAVYVKAILAVVASGLALRLLAR
jgi:hypothetical protein